MSLKNPGKLFMKTTYKESLNKRVQAVFKNKGDHSTY